MQETRWGVIGPGNIARQFAKDLALLPSPQVVHAVLGHSTDSTDQFAKEFNVPNIYNELDQFVKDDGIDIVYVATPHTLHYEQVLACLENKLPVLCEKPMVINREQCEELVNTAKKNSTFLMEGMWLRFLPSIQHLLAIIAEDKIGNIVSIKATMCYKAPYDPESRYFNPELGGGSLLDLGIYPVFLTYLLLGKPDTIKAIGTLSKEKVDLTCSVLFHYKNGQHAVLESSLATGTDLPAEISGDKGIIRILNPWFEKSAGLEWENFEKEKNIYPTSWDGHGLQFEAQEVLNCLSRNETESKIIPHQFSLDIMEIMDEIREQIRLVYEKYE